MTLMGACHQGDVTFGDTTFGDRHRSWTQSVWYGHFGNYWIVVIAIQFFSLKKLIKRLIKSVEKLIKRLIRKKAVPQCPNYCGGCLFINPFFLFHA
ncbi:MAG: hypothetical protein K0S80_399 [Neobacillus sp.]|nr:hypothetical protein [Neobacillus sp.]